MITWMQRHKKWLIITVWVSTIAFVGAGFVGWGSYDYGKSNGTVAIVNGNEVPVTDLQNEYSTLYSQYSQMFGSSFNQELAKQLKLEEMALQRTIQKHMLLNYAQEIGLSVTDKEVATELVKIPSFLKDGKFDKNTYMSVLKQNRKSAADFEDQLKQDLLAQKVQNIYSTKLSSKEIEGLSKLLFSEDKVSIKIIDSKDIKINASDKDIKVFWEETKENYKSDEGFNISYNKIANIDGKTKKEMKKVALKEYLELKKGESKFDKTATIYENGSFLPKEDFEKISKASNNKLLKPIYKDNQYYVIKVLKKIPPQTLPFEEVKDEVKSNYIASKTTEILDQKAQAAMKNFKGKDIGYISRAKAPTVKGLNEAEASQLVQDIFASTKLINVSKLGTKAVVFKITDSKLASYDPNNDNAVISSIESIKNNSLFSGLLSALEKKYEIKSFMENN